MTTYLIVLLIALLILISVLGEMVFRRFNIPDVLILIAFGILLGPILHFVNVDVNSVIIAVFSVLALTIVMFDGGISLDLKEIIRNTPIGMKISIINFLILLIIFTISYHIANFFGFKFLDLQTLILLASILGGTSGIVVIPLLNKLNIKEKVKNVLILESTITDALTIVVTSSLLLYFASAKGNFSTIFKNIASSFSISIVLGLLFALLWANFIDKFLHLKEIKNYKYLIILSSLLIIYIISSVLGASAAITIFIFALILGNLHHIRKAFEIQIKNKILSREIFLMNIQFSFLIKTFFFFLIGALVSLNIKTLIYSLILFFLVVLARFISVLILFKKESLKEKLFITFFTPKGLAASILAIFVANSLHNKEIIGIVFDIIFISIVVASLAAAIYNILNKKEEKINLELISQENDKKETKENKEMIAN
ncbi:MAG: cation:proton antiporter [Nanoarchaeota archaeon]